MQPIDSILDKSLSELGISMQVVNCLKKANILTVRNVIERGIKKPGNVVGFNRKMFEELKQKLNSIGVSVI